MELNVTPLQFRLVTYATAVNKIHSWKETRLRVREGWELLSASDHSLWGAFYIPLLFISTKLPTAAQVGPSFGFVI